MYYCPLCENGLMIGHPEGVLAVLVHALGVAHHLAQRLAQLRLRRWSACDHVRRLWTPRYETFPMYQSPPPEILEGKAA